MIHQRWVFCLVSVAVGFALGMAAEGLRKDSVKSQRKNAASAVAKADIVNSRRWDNPGLAEYVETHSAGLTAASLPEILREGDDWRRSRGLEDLGITLAKTNLPEAFGLLDQLQSQEDRDSLIRGVFHFLGRRDRQVALRQIGWLTKTTDRNAAFTILAMDWGLKSVDLFQQLNLEQPSQNGRLLLKLKPPQTEVALAWAEQLRAREGKEILLADIAGSLLETSPAEAMKLGAELQGEDYVNFLQKVTASWADTDPQAALAWAMRLPDATLRESLLRTAVQNWMISKPGLAQEEFKNLPPGLARKVMLEEITGYLSVVSKNPNDWVKSRADPIEKGTAQRILAEQEVIGIGVSLKIVDGLPVVGNVVGESPAGRSQLLQKGDRIVGVDATGNGVYVSTNGMNTEEVSAMIRGKAGTPVRLRVASLNAKGFDMPREVQLFREKL